MSSWKVGLMVVTEVLEAVLEVAPGLLHYSLVLEWCRLQQKFWVL
jgi:hypothetical protein